MRLATALITTIPSMGIGKAAKYEVEGDCHVTIETLRLLPLNERNASSQFEQSFSLTKALQRSGT